MPIPILAAAGTAVVKTAAIVGQAAVATAKAGMEVGTMAGKVGGQVATNTAQTLVPKATQGVGAVTCEQTAFDLKTGKIMPDEWLKADSAVQTADLGAQKAMNVTPSAEVVEAAPIRYNLLTRNHALEGDVHPVTGVPFERKTVVDAEGNLATGVFPRFESSFEAKLPEDMLKASDKEQFAECNRQLRENIGKHPDAAKSFSAEQLEQIRNGDTPDGYTWHHSEEIGKMPLVKSDVHGLTGHTGGRSIWGGGSEFRV